jgi:hypothetical protein
LPEKKGRDIEFSADLCYNGDSKVAGGMKCKKSYSNIRNGF